MECIINQDIAIMLAQRGFFYIMHRFNIDVVAFANAMKTNNLPISISIGVNDDAYQIMQTLQEQNLIPDYVTVDIAHGHSMKMQKMLKYLNSMPTVPFIIAGNVSTAQGVKDLESWGANAIKVGIGPGAACTTYTATGFGSRGAQASIIKLCADSKTNINTMIIADGGIKEPGDIAKSIALGADLVMVGGMFSGLKDSPGNIVKGADGLLYKEFWGSASAFQSGKQNRIEGTKKLVQLKQNTFLEELQHINECLQSAISYAGGTTIYNLKGADFIKKLT